MSHRSNNNNNFNINSFDVVFGGAGDSGGGVPLPKSNFETITIRPGRILWHARSQPLSGLRRNVMNSPDYLYTSPQISQAILHGLSHRRGRGIVELTKLRVKKPLHLVNFKNPYQQVNFAMNHGMNNFITYTTDDIKLLKKLCESGNKSIDGWRAVWDQDQIALCARVIRDKLERVSYKNFPSGALNFSNSNINFVRAKKVVASYYETMNKTKGRKLVKTIKSDEKKKAVTRKNIRRNYYQRAVPLLKSYLKK